MIGTIMLEPNYINVQLFKRLGQHSLSNQNIKLLQLKNQRILPKTLIKRLTITSIQINETINYFKSKEKGRRHLQMLFRQIRKYLISPLYYQKPFRIIKPTFKQIKLLIYLTNQSLTSQSCEARIISLKKVYPEIPKENQFRPIVILSSLYKFIELRLIDKLNIYNKTYLSHYQSGFICGKNTQINIKKIINLINTFQKNDKIDLIYIDFKSAYNTINRKKLYQILRDKQILENNEITFLETLHKNVYYQDPINKKEKYWFQNGVVQGSPICPPLFNIYLDSFLNQLKRKCPYADDLAFWIKHKYTNNFLDSEQWNLNMNKTKSAIIQINNHTNIQQQDILGNKNQIPNYLRYLFLNQWQICPMHGVLCNFNHFLKNHIKMKPDDFIDYVTGQRKCLWFMVQKVY